MKFISEKERVKLVVCKSRAKGLADDRTVVVEFGLFVDGDISRQLPANIRDGWKEIRVPNAGVTKIEFDSTVLSQNIRLYRLPTKSAELDFEMENVDLKKICLERADTKDVFLYFQVQHAMTKNAWQWLWYSFAREVFAEFEECQTELDLPAKKGESIN